MYIFVSDRYNPIVPSTAILTTKVRSLFPMNDQGWGFKASCCSQCEISRGTSRRPLLSFSTCIVGQACENDDVLFSCWAFLTDLCFVQVTVSKFLGSVIQVVVFHVALAVKHVDVSPRRFRDCGMWCRMGYIFVYLTRTVEHSLSSSISCL